MNKYKLDWNEYASAARQAVAEGVVLLKNEDCTLPIRAGETVSIFGRIQCHYVKSGTGSGGLVNAKHVVGIPEGLKANPGITVDSELEELYAAWVAEHPFDLGKGWAQEPWSQVEMPLAEEVVEAASKRSDIALVLIGRTAGEDRDNHPEQGSLLLSDLEEEMIAKVTRHFARVAVVLNVGNVIDMKWVDRHRVPAVLYGWQGGMEGGNGVADVLVGNVSPCGKLSDTITTDIADHPSTANFGGEHESVYVEDIYVGYRYFETVAQEKVKVPFGFGLSYTTFTTETTSFEADGENIFSTFCVRNTGEVAGKEVVQVYVSAPQGKLGKAARSLVAFAKTGVIAPGAAEEVKITFPRSELASYDDGGITGHKSCFVLEDGEYRFFAGSDVRQAAFAGNFLLAETVVVRQLEEAAAPVKAFKRLKPVNAGAGFVMSEEETPLRTVDLPARIRNNLPETHVFTGDKGIRLADVFDGKAELGDFVAQLTDEELACMTRGEGMCSPKVTPGTAGAFGGVTDSLLAYGIPVACCADGPSGIRMDCGTNAFAMPNGTALACTFNTVLIEQLYGFAGLELRKNRVDTLLGPGMNLHRNPLNGRNFEYFSEDPLLTGKMAAAQLRGMHRYGVTGTVKHFAANNQEFHRHDVDAVISERALRELYLKGFEIAVREGGAFSVMSSYNAINGIWAASHYDLLTTLLRNEWGFDGMVMTDWWAKMNGTEGEPGVRDNTAAMIRGQNDTYMVVSDAASNSNRDNTAEGLKAGKVTRAELQRAAFNILKTIMRYPVMERFLGRTSVEERAEWKLEEETGVGQPPFDLVYHDLGDETIIDTTGIDTTKGASTLVGLKFKKRGMYMLSLEMRAEAEELAQIPLSIYVDTALAKTVSLKGTDRDWVREEIPIGSPVNSVAFLRLYFGQGGMVLGTLRITFQQEFGWKL